MGTNRHAVDRDAVEAVRRVTQSVIKKVGPRYWLKVVKENRRPNELTDAMAEAGLFGVGLSEDLGGSGGGIYEEAAMIEELGKGGIAQSFVIIPNFARRMVAKWGTSEQRSAFIAQSLKGEANTCFAITEAGSGTNAFAMRTTAKIDGDGWRINGEKAYISNAGAARQMLLVARTGTNSRGSVELSLFVINLPADGLTVTAMDIRATKPETQYIVHFDDVWVPSTAVVGEPGAGTRTVFSALNAERILVSTGTVGLGFNALDKAAAYVRDRAPFGRPTGTYQGVQHPLARCYMQLMGARSIAYEAAAAEDAGEDSASVGLLANTAKFLASEAAHAAIDTAVQVCGGFAFDWDSDLMWMYEYIRLRRVAPINNEMVMNYIAERALDLPRSY